MRAFRIQKDVNTMGQLMAKHLGITFFLPQSFERNEAIRASGGEPSVCLINRDEVESDHCNVVLAGWVESLESKNASGATGRIMRFGYFNMDCMSACIHAFP